MPTFVLHGTDDHPHSKIDYHRELNQEQLEVVLHGEGPCLVLAGAGSGKTRTVTYRVAYLLERGVHPSTILLLTFTNKAAREMTERAAALIGTKGTGVWGGTFHSIANRFLRKYATELGYTSAFSILDQDDSKTLLKAVLKDASIDVKAQRFPSPAVVQDILSYSRNVLTPITSVIEAKYRGFERFAPELEAIGQRYAERKRAANAMDFDDLLVNWLRLVEHPEIGPALAERFQYVLVDEYQDTNTLQARIVRGLASVHRNLLVVGDDAQSIYAFRGADVKNILRFPHEWPDAKLFKLVTNYRSVPEILDVANDSLSHNVDQYEKELVSVKPRGAKPFVVPTASAAQEAQYIAEQILALRAEGIPLTEIAVLFRSSAHSQTLEFELAKRDIPYEYRGGMRFFGRAHIKDAVSYLRIVTNMRDEAAWLRTLMLHEGIGATTASAIVKRVAEFSDIRAVVSADTSRLVPSRAQTGWKTYCTIMREMAEANGPSAMLRILLRSSYREYLEREYPDWRDRVEDVEQLTLFAESYTDVSSFLTDISLYDDVWAGREGTADSQQETERCILSTIHQAKGLEWDTVFIMHLADQSFPNRRAMEEQNGMEEERRLFYVAVTRARHRLYLTYPRTIGYDTLILNRMSVFLDELAPRLTERLEVRDARSSRIISAGAERGWGNRRESEDTFWEEDEVIAVDENGERQSPPKKSLPKTSFLRDIEDL